MRELGRREPPPFLVVLAERVLDRNDRVVVDPGGELVDELVGAEAAVLARQHVLSVDEQLRGGDVHCDRRLGAGLEAAPLDPLEQHVQGRAVRGSGAARPPSSATSATSWPRSRRTAAVAARTREAHSIASANVRAPTGTTRKSWTSTRPPACAPPEITFTIGSGSSGGRSGLRARHSGTPMLRAAATAQATEAARTAFAPSRSRFGGSVECAQWRRRPRSGRRASRPTSSGAISARNAATAPATPLPA